MNDTQAEITRLREEVEQLRKALTERSTPLPQFDIANDPPSPFLNNFELITDLTRFAEGLLEEKHVRKKWRFTEDTWTALGHDDKLVEAIELEKTRRIRDGSFKRERSQQLVTKGPDVLDKILCNEKNSPKHRIDAVKALDDLAEGGSRATHNDSERVIVTIRLGKDEPPLVVDAAVNPSPSNVIDATPTPIQSHPNNTVDEPPPVKRGPGRPPGSKNKPKTPTPQELLPYITRQTDNSGGTPL